MLVESRFRSVSVVTVLVVTAGFISPHALAEKTPSAEQPNIIRPNIVWLVSEDNSIHFLKLFHQHGAETPHIAQLAAHGLLFERAFSNAPVCSVARTTLITGCYAPRIGTQFHRRVKMAAMPAGLQMFPAYLRQAGYYTSNNSKKDYNAHEGPGVWDASSNQASWRNRADGQPFFHMQSFGVSHESSLHFSEADMQRPTKANPKQMQLAPYHPDTPTFRYTYARYHDRIQEMDRQIGSVVQQLEEDGLLESTFVFYFGDHGGVLPRSKGYAYDTGLHVPLVVRVPKSFRHLVAADSLPGRVQQFVSFVDFAPTILHLAGLPVPASMDGQPFLGPDQPLDDESKTLAYGYADRFDEKYDFVRTLRNGQLKYIRNYQPYYFDGLQNNYRYRMLAFRELRNLFEKGQLDAVKSQFFRRRSPEQLFDLHADPYEVHDLSKDPRYQTELATLRSQLQTFETDLPDLSFIPESHLVADALDNPVQYGQQQKSRISKLIQIADLSLEDVSVATPQLLEYLQSDDALERYWALISCTALEVRSESIRRLAWTMAASDQSNLARARAAEFLALTSDADITKAIETALQRSENPTEANLILNSVVLLRDGPPRLNFHLDRSWFSQFDPVEMNECNRRLDYLLSP